MGNTSDHNEAINESEETKEYYFFKSQGTSQARMLEAQRLTKMGDFIWDVETGQVTWSDALFELLGYDKTEEIDMARVNTEIHHPDDLVRVSQWLNDCIASNKAEMFSNEYRLICKDGRLIDVNVVVVIQRWPGESTKVFGAVQDITKRKQAEVMLRASEEKYRLLFESMTEGFVLHEIITDERGQPCDFRFLEMNPACERLTGLCRAEVIGRRVREITTEPPWIERYARVALTGQAEHFQDYNTTLKRWFEIFAFQPKPGQCAVVFSDITERIKTEQALQESRRQLATLLSNLPGMAYRCLNKPSWPMEYVSEGSRALTGYSPEELGDFENPLYGQLIHPDDRSVVWESVQKGLQDGTSFVVEYRLRDRQGNEHWVWEQGQGVEGPNGEIVALEGFITDITERKKTEMALKGSEERFRSAFENIPDVVVIYSKDLRIRYINAATSRLTGRPISDYIGKRDEEAWPEGQYQCYLPTLQESARTGKTLVLETVFPSPQGGARNLRITCVPLTDDNGEIREILGITHDFTERQRSAERIRQAQQQLLDQQEYEKERVKEELAKTQDKLVRTTRLAAIGQVSASIAHDLRNPLGAVHNATYLLKRYLPNADEKITRQVQVIEQEVQRSNQIITNLLSLAQAKEPQKRNLPLNELIQEVFVLINMPKDILWSLKTDPDPFLVHVDITQFRQVVQNILTNAVEAMAGIGQFSIEAWREGANDVILFRDTGPGFSAQIQGDPLEPLITTKTTGTGLGLTICRDIITRHGGTISIANEGDSGAVIRITLPHDPPSGND